MKPEYEWDEAKNKTNMIKHGVSFDTMTDFNWDYALCMDVQFVEVEERELWLGPIDTKLFVAVTVERVQGIVRIISLRRATTPETSIWKKEYVNG